MAVDATGQWGQPLFDNSHGFDLSVDQDAISNYAASIIAAMSTMQGSNSYMDLSAGVSYASPDGLNAVVSLGSLRIVWVSLASGAGISVGSTIANMKSGHRPYQLVTAGAHLTDGGGNSAGAAYITPSGSIGVDSLVPDASGDGKFFAVRATFIYVASF